MGENIVGKIWVLYDTEHQEIHHVSDFTVAEVDEEPLQLLVPTSDAKFIKEVILKTARRQYSLLDLIAGADYRN